MEKEERKAEKIHSKYNKTMIMYGYMLSFIPHSNINNNNNNNNNKNNNVYRGRSQSLESAFHEGHLFNKSYRFT